jgi:hypothetical protein
MRIGLLFYSVLSGTIALGQTHAALIAANPDYTAVVNDHLVGPGVAVINASYLLLPYAIGTFTDTIGSIGMTEGLVLATGLVHVIEAPNLSQSTTMGGGVSGMADIDLQQLLNPPATQWDAAILSIELIPAGDTLSLRYVFGSEEYDEYVCSIKNDVMGIFLSGPGIDGSFSNDGINMATLPATGLPVCVNTVNLGVPGSNGEGLCWAYPNWQMDTVHYVDNFFGPDCGLDGYTEVLTAKAAVQPGAVYQLRIAIADAHDGIYDSAVFLEAGSLTSELSTGADAAVPGSAGVWYVDATGELMLRGDEWHDGRVEVQAFDAAGRCVARAMARGECAMWRAPMSLAAGCYAIRAVMDGKAVSGRVVVR